MTYFDTSSKMPPRIPPITGQVADPNFVRYMISREDVDGEYCEHVFGCEESDSDMIMSDDDI